MMAKVCPSGWFCTNKGTFIILINLSFLQLARKHPVLSKKFSTITKMVQFLSFVTNSQDISLEILVL